jgi:hypothetical protein
LTRSASYRARVCLAVASLLAVLLSGCGVPVAPGYKIQKENLTVHFVPGSPPHLAVRAQYELANVGNAPLESIGVTLPGEKEFGRANLRAEIDGKEITLQHNPHEAPDDWRIPLPAPWRQKQKRNLMLSYDLGAQPVSDPRIFVSANTFYLNDSGWFPGLMSFKVFLSPAVVRPNPTALSVVIPADFRVTASGQPSGSRKQNGETEYRFRIRKPDFDPYVLAGQYSEQRVSSGGVTVAVWTLGGPIPASKAQDIAAQVAPAVNVDVQNLGRLPKSLDKIFVVDFPRKVRMNGDDDPTQGFLLPGVVPGDTPYASVQDVIAHTWFAHLIAPRPEAWLLAEGLAFHPGTVSGPGNNQIPPSPVPPLLSRYDADKLKAVEKPIISLLPTDPLDQLRIGADKIQLFFFALEDKCGPENVRHAIADMVYALRGEDYGYSDFRAALEQQCHQDLGGFFRTWLTRPGIPADFRARYQNVGGNKQ